MLHTITLIIAIVGAVTGIIALIIQFVEYRKSAVKLKVQINDENSYSMPTGNKYIIGSVSAKISNCSSQPITIDEVFAVLGKNRIEHLNVNEQKEDEIPRRIDCYDTTFITFHFCWFDDFVNKEFELHLITPRKIYKRKVKVKEYVPK